MSCLWVGVAFLKSTPTSGDTGKQIEYEEFKRMRGCMYNWSLWLMDLYVSTKRFSHCEIALPCENDPSQLLAYTVTQKDGCIVVMREFLNPNYKWICLRLESYSDYKKIVKFCDKQLGKPWDRNAAQCSVFWPTFNKKEDGNWWCASLVVAALKKVGYLKHYSPYNLEIDEIHDLLLSIDPLKRIVGNTPSLYRAVQQLEKS